jgi:hypothetical protein
VQATKERGAHAPKTNTIAILNGMGLNQIANWVQVLPDDRWQAMFVSYWPTLAKKCGVVD